ncbi:hypothetical protein AO715_14910 [Xanthomonas sp. Mitacek01]|nr:hypothetical protein AO715_14910 [Xanthomonas sp. Mitacek01]
MIASIPQMRQIGVLDGLPSNRVNDIVEDRQGYLWIGTRDGLARFDGIGFRVWRVEDGLRDNFVWAVHLDDQDRIWIGTRRGGLSMLDAERATFTHYNHETHPQIRGDDVWNVTSTPDGAIWFGTADAGLYRLALGGDLQRFDADPDNPRAIPSGSVGHLAVHKDGTLWVGTKGGVVRFTGSDFERMVLPADVTGSVNGMVFDASGDLWIAALGLGVVRRSDGRVEKMAERDPVLDLPVLHMLMQDRSGTRWFDTRSGLAREVDGQLEDVPLFSFASRSALRPSWSMAYEDREGGLWFASTDAGLWHLPANWRNFTVLQRRLTDPDSSANAFVRGVAASRDGGFWLVGSGGVLDHLDPVTGRIRHRLRSVCGDTVNRSVYESRNGYLWIGCLGQLVRFDPRTDEVVRWFVADSVNAAPMGETDHIVEQSDGTLWLASEVEIQARRQDGQVLATLQPETGWGLPRSVRPLHFTEAPDEGIWLGTTGGLYRVDASEHTVERVPGGPDKAVNAISRQADVFWFAGPGYLSTFRWNGTKLVPLQHFDQADGIPLVTPGGIAIDDRGIVWVTTVRGLLRFEPTLRRARLYSMLDGLPSQEFSEQQIGVSRDGHFAVGTAEGLLLFHPGLVHRRTRTPPLVIETLDLRRGDDEIELSPDEPIRLRDGDRDLRVVARLLSFTDAHAHHYRFLLEGYETEWVDADETAERVFPRLESGRYTLHVEARTEDGDWTALAPLSIHQAPPWWRTVWASVAALLFVMLLVALVASAYRQRLRRKASWHLAEHKRELAEQASLAKSRFLATLGHEVRTPMTGVLGMSELLLNTELDARQRGFAESIRRAGDHLMRLVNDALDLARIEAGRLELDPQPFEPARLVQDVAALCAPMARQKALGFDTVFHEALPGWVLGDAGRVQQILLNLLGNAVKFTESGSVGLQAGIGADRALVFVVSDTGPGLSPEQRERLFRRFEQAEGVRTASRYGGSGLGLAISQELTVAMGGRIELDSTPGEGTRFTVHLPLPVVDAAPSVQQDEAYRQITSAVGLEILLVEDDQTVADVIVGLLESQGHDVVHAAHGLAALSEITTRSFDLAMLDLDLPGIDGLTLAGMMRGHGFAQPMVAVTARADADAEVIARAAGFDGFLRKPLTGEMLSDTLASNWRPTRDDDEPQGGL